MFTFHISRKVKLSNNTTYVDAYTMSIHIYIYEYYSKHSPTRMPFCWLMRARNPDGTWRTVRESFGASKSIKHRISVAIGHLWGRYVKDLRAENPAFLGKKLRLHIVQEYVARYSVIADQIADSTDAVWWLGYVIVSQEFRFGNIFLNIEKSGVLQ